MTSKEFKKIQQDLGLNNKKMADALKTSYRNIDNWRGGKSRIPGPVIVALYFLIEQHK
jgi:DNA-binding transcriptional regulator YiaG